MNLDTRIALTSLILSITGFLLCIPGIIQRQSKTSYIENFPIANGIYTVNVASDCLAELTIESPEKNVTKYTAELSLSFKNSTMQLSGTTDLTTESNGTISLAQFSLNGKGLSLNGHYQGRHTRQFLLSGTFFSQEVLIDTQLDSDLQLLQTSVGSASLRGPLSRSPLQQTLQVSVLKQLDHLTFSNHTGSCQHPFDITPLLNHILDMQNTTPGDILRSMNPEERRYNS